MMTSASGVVNGYKQALPREFYNRYPNKPGFYHFYDINSPCVFTKTKNVIVSIEENVKMSMLWNVHRDFIFLVRFKHVYFLIVPMLVIV